MRRTRLNVVPPVSKEVVLGQIIDGDKVMSLAGQKAALSAVTESYAPDNYGAVPSHESRTQRVQRLQEEARALAAEQVAEFEILLQATARMAEEIAKGGDVYNVGVREVCRQIAQELPNTLQTLKIVASRH